jgi:hypothetical protein
MIEFVLKNRKLRLHPDGVMYVRAHYRGEETKSEKWKEVKFNDCKGYKRCRITLDGIETKLYQHRIVWYAHNQSWDIWDTSKDNVIDHINRNPSDNSIKNLRVVTNQENCFNRDVKGYYWDKRRCKFLARIHIDGTSKHIGYFEKEEDASAAYIKAKVILHKINLN